MKTYDLEVSRAVISQIRVTVPDDFDSRKLMYSIYGKALGDVAEEQLTHGCWDDYDKSVEVDGITEVADDGQFPCTDVTEIIAAVDAKLKADREAYLKGKEPVK